MMAEARRLGITTDDVLEAIHAVASTPAAAHTATQGDQP
jgi:hypothetical protein